MNIALLVLLGIGAWSAVSVVVALAIGAMAKARDTDAPPLLDRQLAAGRMAPPARDQRVRAAI